MTNFAAVAPAQSKSPSCLDHATHLTDQQLDSSTSRMTVCSLSNRHVQIAVDVKLLRSSDRSADAEPTERGVKPRSMK
jgi:hypothetical protein